jgi:hypothetical protein
LCRGQLGEIQGDLAIYALTVDVQELPAHARERFEARLAQETRALPTDREAAAIRQEPVRQESVRRQETQEPVPVPVPAARVTSIHEPRGRAIVDRGRAAVIMAWAGWAIAAAVGVFAFLQLQQRQELQGSLAAQNASLTQASQQAAQAQNQAARAVEALQTLTGAGAMQVSLHVPAEKVPQPEAHAAYIASKGALVLVASHLNSLAAGKTYELWLLPAQPNGAPIPAGTFKPDAQGNASVVLPTIPAGVAAKGFGVTIEPDGGSAAPTPPIVLAGF